MPVSLHGAGTMLRIPGGNKMTTKKILRMTVDNLEERIKLLQEAHRNQMNRKQYEMKKMSLELYKFKYGVDINTIRHTMNIEKNRFKNPLELHRCLADIFDDFEMMDTGMPTVRHSDTVIKVNPPWIIKIGTKEFGKPAVLNETIEIKRASHA